ncbi:MAG: hypothetical protein OXK80_06245 [Bdellovibrionales bacterium]|nr:hypothetical protein [Bdellovibrionales bacterium]
MNSFDVVILSVDGRGISLANQLAQTKKVAFIKAFNPYVSEDLEGPFGFFIDSVRPSYWEESPDGFSIKTLEKSFHFKETLLSSVYQERIEYQNLLSGSLDHFKDNWLRPLLVQLTTGVDKPLNDMKNSDVSFVFKDFGLLKHNSQTLNSGISVFKGNDLNFDDKLKCFSHPEFGEIKSRELVCLLNPEEARRFNEDFYHIFFSKSYAHPYWCWQRLTFDFEDEGYPVPVHLVLADPNDIPWDHERLICLKKSLAVENHMSVWMKIPYSSCDFEESLQKINTTLKKYFPNFKWSCQSDGWETPTCLWPVYSKKGLSQMQLKSPVYYGWSAEDLSPNGFFSREQNILKSLS